MAFQSKFKQNINIIWRLTQIAELKSYINHARILPSLEEKINEQVLSQFRTRDGLDAVNYTGFIQYIREACQKPGYHLEAREIYNLYCLITGSLPNGSETFLKSGGKEALNQIATWLKVPGNQKVPPPLLAVVAYNEFLQSRPFVTGNRGGAAALGIAVLYNTGYYCRGMLALDRVFDLDEGPDCEEISPLVEAFCINMETQLVEVVEKVREAEDITAQETIRHIQRLNPRQNLFIQALQRQKTITAGEFKSGYLSGAVSRETIRKDIVEILEMGLIEGSGTGRNRCYQLKNPLLKGVKNN
ncbi:MAG: Fic family protein [Thermincolia bacterium]